MELETSLTELGLTKNEAKVYLALLDIGSTTTSKIIKKTGINTSKVYESLERLLKKGMASYSIITNKKHWQAENPSSIIEYIDEQRDQLERKKQSSQKIISELLARKNLTQETSEYKIYEGIKGIKSARENALDVLKKGDTFYIILSAYPKDDKLEAYWREFQERRSKKGVNCRYILNETLRPTGEQRSVIPFTDIRYVKPESLSPTWIEIYKDHVAIGVLGSSPSIFVIKNDSVAKGFINYFTFLWEQGSK